MKPKAAMTLDRMLSRYGACSRTAAREAIHAGRVRVNGGIERNPERWVQQGREHVQFDGARLKAERKVYLAFYKPKGVIVSHGDPSGRKTIYDCLKDEIKVAGANGDRQAPWAGAQGPWLAPVGRLDKDTSGLLLVTNDTAFAHFVTSPESGVPKTYRVKLSGLMSEDTLAELRSGVRMKRGDEARPRSVCRLEDRGK
jgi:23S rRNA pseudouridine2605 synthase